MVWIQRPKHARTSAWEQEVHLHRINSYDSAGGKENKMAGWCVANGGSMKCRARGGWGRGVVGRPQAASPPSPRAGQCG